MDLTRRTLIAVGIASMCAHRAAFAADDSGVPPADHEVRVPVVGGSLYVRVNGNLSGPRPPLLMVHGGPGGALWQFFPVLPLASDRAIILYDQLDSGRSDAPGDKANWTVDRFASEIDAIRKALGVGAFHLLGHSWGGIVSTHYAARNPKGLRSLILQATPLSARRFDSSVRSLYAVLPDGLGTVIEAHERAGTLDDPAYINAVRLFMRTHLNRTSTRAVGAPYMAHIPENRGDALAMAMIGDRLTPMAGALKGFDDERLLDRIRVPTMLLCGEFDIMTPAATRAMLPKLRRGSFAELPGAGHMAQFDTPDAWRDAISRFVTAHDG